MIVMSLQCSIHHGISLLTHKMQTIFFQKHGCTWNRISQQPASKNKEMSALGEQPQDGAPWLTNWRMVGEWFLENDSEATKIKMRWCAVEQSNCVFVNQMKQAAARGNTSASVTSFEHPVGNQLAIISWQATAVSFIFPHECFLFCNCPSENLIKSPIIGKQFLHNHKVMWNCFICQLAAFSANFHCSCVSPEWHHCFFWITLHNSICLEEIILETNQRNDQGSCAQFPLWVLTAFHFGC